MSRKIQKNAESTPNAGSADRRDFLVKSGMLLGLLALAGVSEAEATGSVLNASQGDALRLTLQAAFKSNDIKGALEAHGKGLPSDLRSRLSTLSRSDLQTLAKANQIISQRIPRLTAADNNGYFGM